jgi:hypothetical protein
VPRSCEGRGAEILRGSRVGLLGVPSFPPADALRLPRSADSQASASVSELHAFREVRKSNSGPLTEPATRAADRSAPHWRAGFCSYHHALNNRPHGAALARLAL